jgi:hypothetical protein
MLLPEFDDLACKPRQLKAVPGARVVGPGGTVAAYLWDSFGDEVPTSPIAAALSEFGIQYPLPPRADASRPDVLRALWANAGLEAIETREIAVRRTFASFEDCWRSCASFPTSGPAIAKMAPADVEKLKALLAERLPADASGRVTYQARANAIKGRLLLSPRL